MNLSGVLRRILFRGRFPRRPGPPRTTALTEVLQPGDVVLHRDRGDLLGGLIGHFTASPYSHAELYYGAGWSLPAEAHGISFALAESSAPLRLRPPARTRLVRNAGKALSGHRVTAPNGYGGPSRSSVPTTTSGKASGAREAPLGTATDSP